MRNTILKSAVISFIVTTLLCAMNWILTLVLGSCIGIGSRGGEYHATNGFGVMFEEFYPLTTIDDPKKYSCRTSFHFISYILTFVVIFVISFVIKKIHKNKQAQKESMS